MSILGPERLQKSKDRSVRSAPRTLEDVFQDMIAMIFRASMYGFEHMVPESMDDLWGLLKETLGSLLTFLFRPFPCKLLGQC